MLARLALIVTTLMVALVSTTLMDYSSGGTSNGLTSDVTIWSVLAGAGLLWWATFVFAWMSAARRSA